MSAFIKIRIIYVPNPERSPYLNEILFLFIGLLLKLRSEFSQLILKIFIWFPSKKFLFNFKLICLLNLFQNLLVKGWTTNLDQGIMKQQRIWSELGFMPVKTSDFILSILPNLSILNNNAHLIYIYLFIFEAFMRLSTTMQNSLIFQVRGMKTFSVRTG